MKKNVLKSISFTVIAVVMAVVTMSLASVAASAVSNTYTYRITVNTADVSKAGTDKDVYLYAYDAQGNQIGNRIGLDTSGNSFEKGDSDVVTITLPTAMKSVKMATFGQPDNFFDSFEDDWMLDNVVAELMNGDKVISTTTYEFDSWIECGWYAYVSGNKYPVAEAERLYSPSDIIRENGFEYAVLADGTAEIIGYTGSEKNLVIPEYVDGYKVTAVGNYVFDNNVKLRSVTIPDGVTSIGKGAFLNCIMLTDIQIPDSVNDIGSGAFYCCTSLTNVTLPDSLKSVEASAFEGCSTLGNIIIPNSVTTIGEKAFYDCHKLSEVYASENITSVGENAFGKCASYLHINGYSKAVHQYAEKNGIVFSAPESDFYYTDSADNTVEITGCRSNSPYVVVPETINGRKVISIGEMAFMAGDVETVILPDCIKEINYLAFAVCESLTEIKLPADLRFIGTDSFAYCNNLKSVEIPEGTEHILGGAFSNCTSLKSVTIPESVISISTYAFSSCESLTEVTIPKSVEYIAEGAFENCSDSLLIIGHAASEAERYALANNINFCYMKTEL